MPRLRRGTFSGLLLHTFTMFRGRFAFLLALTMASIGIGIAIGPGGLPSNRQILMLRVIRTMLAFVTGMSLAVNGAALQSLFANPLVDPHIAGISGGAALGYVSAILLGAPFYLASMAAIGTGWGAALLVFAIAASGGYVNRGKLLLGGISIGMFASSAVMLLLALKGESALFAIRFILGYIGVVLTSSELTAYLIEILIIVAMALFLWYLSRELDALHLGDSEAMAIGVDVNRLKSKVFFATSISTGLLVSMVGIVGFIGLVVPHMTRRIIGTGLHKKLLPSSALLGASIAIITDAIARTAFSFELPLGILTSLFGIPIFVYLVQKELSL